MKKILAAIAAVFITTQASAYYGVCEPCPEPCDNPCNQPFYGCVEPCYVTTPCHPPYTYPCAPDAYDPKCGWFVSASYLCWNIREEGLDYGPANITQVGTGSDITTIVDRQVTKHPHFKWNSGFRVGIGHESFWNGWGSEVVWTSISSHVGNSIDSDNFTNWNIHFNTIDGFLFRTFDVKCFGFTPFIGVRGAFISQKQHLYDVDILNTPDAVFPVVVDEHNKQTFGGGGPLLGLRVEFDYCCFNYFAEVGGSAVFGKFTVKCQERDLIASLEDEFHTRRNPRNCQFTADGAIGIGYNTSFCYGRVAYNVALGYEYHRYFSQNYIGEKKGDLILHGVTISQRITF